MIYGECVSASAHAPVTISQLGAGGCRVRVLARKTILTRESMLDGDQELWIGAIGPLAITAERDGSNSFNAQFKQPLEPAIIAHFNL